MLTADSVVLELDKRCSWLRETEGVGSFIGRSGCDRQCFEKLIDVKACDSLILEPFSHPLHPLANLTILASIFHLLPRKKVSAS